jgi:hypothetical protein
MTAALY